MAKYIKDIQQLNMKFIPWLEHSILDGKNKNGIVLKENNANQTLYIFSVNSRQDKK